MMLNLDVGIPTLSGAKRSKSLDENKSSNYVSNEQYFKIRIEPISIQKADTIPIKKEWKNSSNWDSVDYNAGQGYKAYRLFFMKNEDF
ncbi:MAG: hypothetical protein ACKVTZ_06955 [Bacteroidia bacterium]